MGKATRKPYKWEIVIKGISTDAFKTRRLKVEGRRYLDFGIRKNNIGRGYLIDHMPTSKPMSGTVYATEDAAIKCIQALYHLGKWDSEIAATYRDRAPKVVEIAGRYGV